MSSRSRKAWPQKRGRMFGKQIEASTWLASMSARRAVWSKQPGRMSSKVHGSFFTTSAPTAAERRVNG